MFGRDALQYQEWGVGGGERAGITYEMLISSFYLQKGDQALASTFPIGPVYEDYRASHEDYVFPQIPA